MNKKRNSTITFTDFLRLGQHQAHLTNCKFKKIILACIGVLAINPRIRSGRVITEIKNQDLDIDVNVLDAGFGFGLAMFYLSKKFPYWSITGYELDDEFVNGAKKIKESINLENLTIIKKDLQEITDYSKFDLIYSSDVLEHIEDDVMVLKNFHRALKPNGRLILHLPYRYNLSKRIFPWFRNYKTPDHVREEYTIKEITNKLIQTGFSVDSFQYGYGLLKGELAFELNNLFNANKYLLICSQVCTFPMSIILAYRDIKMPPNVGNSIVIISKK